MCSRAWASGAVASFMEQCDGLHLWYRLRDAFAPCASAYLRERERERERERNEKRSGVDKWGSLHCAEVTLHLASLPRNNLKYANTIGARICVRRESAYNAPASVYREGRRNGGDDEDRARIRVDHGSVLSESI